MSLCGTALLAVTGAAAPLEPGARGDVVVLLHGLGRFPISMRPIERDLQRAGFTVVNVSYPSWRVPVERIADEHLPRKLAQFGIRTLKSDRTGLEQKETRETKAGPDCVSSVETSFPSLPSVQTPRQRVHFVTHSLGGIVVRRFLATHRVENLGRVVMLGPPNQGSALADWFKCCEVVRWLAGPNLPRLGTGPDDLPAQLGPVDFELGVIAGDRPLFGGFLLGEKPNDSKVTVASTRVAGMKDHAVVHSTHTFLMWNREAREQTVAFVERGQFRVK